MPGRLAIPVLVVAVAAAERLDAARGALATIRDPSTPGAEVIGPALTLALTAVVVVLGAWAGTTVARGPTEGRAALGIWVLWQAASALALWAFDAHPGWLGLPHLAAAMLVAAAAARALGGAWRQATIVRLQLLVLGVLVAAVFAAPITSQQCLEVLRAWGSDPVHVVLAGFAAALLLGAAIRGSARRLLTQADDRLSRHARWLVLALAVATAVVTLFMDSYLATVVAVTMLVIGRFTEAAPAPRHHGVDVRVADWLGVVPVAILTGGLAMALTDSVLLLGLGDLTRSEFGLALALLAGSVLLGWLVGRVGAGGSTTERWRAGLIGGAIAAWLGLAGGAQWLPALLLLGFGVVLELRLLGSSGRAEIAAAVAVALGTTAGVYLRPLSAPPAYGTFALAFIAFAGLLTMLHLLHAVAATRAPVWCPAPERVPVVTLVGAWVALALLLAGPDVHRARLTDRAARRAEPLQAAVVRWLDGRSKGSEATMVLVAASGGGSKAAYWTDLVLDCLLADTDPAGPDRECAGSRRAADRLSTLFLTSSVSGGSVGVRHFLSERAAVRAGRPWVDRTAGRELLSPVTAWGLFHDLPTFMLGLRLDPNRCTSTWGSCVKNADRALVQEAAVAGRDRIRPRGSPPGLLVADGAPFPVPVFNAALDGAQGRLVTSPLNLAALRPDDDTCRTSPTHEPLGGAVDTSDLLDRRHDVSLETAALLTARFPVVEPAARVGELRTTPGNEDCTVSTPLDPEFVRDGGYVENSGLLTITQLLPAIQADIARWKRDRRRPTFRVRIVVVSIDDDPAALDTTRVRARGRSRLGIAAAAGPATLTRLARDQLSGCAFGRDVEYERISPRPHVGATAATGWLISPTAREQDLGSALRKSGPQDAGTFVRRLRRALDGGDPLRRCDPPPAG